MSYMTDIVKRNDTSYNTLPKSEQKKHVLAYFNKFKPISKNLHMDAVDYLIEQSDGALLVKIYNEYQEVPTLIFIRCKRTCSLTYVRTYLLTHRH